MHLLRRAVQLARADRWALATVIQVSGSAPRHPGAKMLVRADGDSVGTIGGGRVEQVVTEQAAEVARGAPATRVRHHLVRDLAMCCGGTMEIYLEPVSPSLPAIEDALALWRRRRPAGLVTPLDGSPKRVDRGSPPAMPRIAGDTFVEPVLPRERLLLFGAGHVGREIGPIAAGLDFEVILCDDGDTGAVDVVPAWASQLVDSFEISDLERAIGPIGVGDYVVITTRDHAVDQRILEQVIANRELAYIGLIGSRGKVGRFRRRLQAKGLAEPALWNRLHAPIGIPIAAETPAEIAISIAGELVRVRRAGET